MSNCSKSDCLIVTGIVFVIVIFFRSMGYVVDGVRKKNDPLESSGTQCAILPPDVRYIEMQKQISKVWHWKYNIEKPISGYVQMRCPTFNHDLNVKIGDRYMGRTDGKSFSAVSQVNIEDCHNNVKYVMRTGNVFDTLVNGNKIFVSLDIRQNGVVKFYVKKEVFITDDIDVWNDQSVKVANLKRNKLNDIASFQGWVWKINLYENNSTNSSIDPLILFSIAGQHSFAEKSDETDMCNEFFNAM